MSWELKDRYKTKYECCYCHSNKTSIYFNERSKGYKWKITCDKCGVSLNGDTKEKTIESWENLNKSYTKD